MREVVAYVETYSVSKTHTWKENVLLVIIGNATIYNMCKATALIFPYTTDLHNVTLETYSIVGR
jgi:hypothetical protein